MAHSQLALTADSGKWRITLIGKNLTDKTHYSFAGDAPLGNGTLLDSVRWQHLKRLLFGLPTLQ